MPNGVLHYLRDADNQIRATATTVTATSAATEYPAGNLKALPIAQAWKSSGLANQNIDIDLGSAKNVSLIALVNHNLSAGARITVTGASNSTFSANTVRLSVPRAARNAWTIRSGTASRQHWRITLEDASNPDGEMRVGYIVIGEADKLPQQFQPGWGRTRAKIIRKSDSDRGTPIVGRTVSSGYRLDLEFLLDHDDTDTLEDMLDSLEADPIFIVPDPTLRHGFFMRFADPQNPWTTRVGVDNGPNQITAAFVSDQEGVDV